MTESTTHADKAEDEATAEAMRSLATLLGMVAPEAEKAGFGILVRLGQGCMAAEPHHSVPAGEIRYEFDAYLQALIDESDGFYGNPEAGL